MFVIEKILKRTFWAAANSGHFIHVRVSVIPHACTVNTGHEEPVDNATVKTRNSITGVVSYFSRIDKCVVVGIRQGIYITRYYSIGAAARYGPTESYLIFGGCVRYASWPNRRRFRIIYM